ncbi:BTB/POZ domain-containing protein 6-like [Contarinia nasturtii]|uniref:BTB/POZ domain-containing protein 6-like n=1 Tax=Contarinia nasturtii TaxID=265458 RepID=UPI0012D3D3AC|nr:BTB/POZ domain-containing protein 6-like [Contarinia nasturtii]
MSVHVFDNKLVLNSCKQLYLDTKTADVNFVFKIYSKRTKSVPAHKNILSVGSPVFNAMFYGPMKEKSDVKIVDSSPEAFKEFLQFFYLGKLRLTPNNIIAVTKLCHKYEVPDTLKLCELALQVVLTINDMSTYYELAILLDLESTITFCEQQIMLNPEVILKSDDFLKYDRKMLDKILELVTSKCNASTIVNAYMSWAKTKCVQNGVVATTTNLKNELGLLVGKIPIDQLSSEEFAQFTVSYKDLFDKTDLEAIIVKMMKQKEKTENERKEIQTSKASSLLGKRPSSVLKLFDDPDDDDYWSDLNILHFPEH